MYICTRGTWAVSTKRWSSSSAAIGRSNVWTRRLRVEVCCRSEGCVTSAWTLQLCRENCRNWELVRISWDGKLVGADILLSHEGSRSSICDAERLSYCPNWDAQYPPIYGSSREKFGILALYGGIGEVRKLLFIHTQLGSFLGETNSQEPRGKLASLPY